jgi:hypothetical protein
VGRRVKIGVEKTRRKAKMSANPRDGFGGVHHTIDGMVCAQKNIQVITVREGKPILKGGVSSRKKPGTEGRSNY